MPEYQPGTKLTDRSYMPYGAHKDSLMEDVPARYLLWLWDNQLWDNKKRYRPEQTAVRDYIIESFSALIMDAPDFIIQHPYYG